MSTSDIRILTLSDVHLGHRKTPTSHIIENLEAILTKDRLSNLDLIIVAGDLFDHAIGFSEEDTLLILRFSILLLSLCATYKISLRILEGTPLHDRGQSKHLEVFNHAAKYNVDFLYVDKVFIEKNERFNLNFLYIPDEWHPDPDQTWIDVKQSLAESNLETVDMTIMHGMFEHQVPKACPVRPHNNSRYESITDRFVIIGHIHQSSKRGKIIAPGSFDRLRHGEEEIKGCWQITLKKNKKLDKVVFIQNKLAKEYRTIDCRGLGFDSAIEKITVVSVRDNSRIRIRAFKSDNALAILEWCKKNFCQHHWTLQVMDINLKNTNDPILVNRMEIHSITPASINDLLNKKMIGNNINSEIRERALNLIKNLD